ncbi:MAG: helix-turn-helix domain-containing protein [Myxococcota bacterium]
MSRRGRRAFQEPKQQRTREQLSQILSVADRLFAERGYEGTRLSDIAAAVPCSMSTIYDRFASKEELLRYMHRQGTEEAIAMIDQIEPADASDVDLRVVLPTAVQIGLSLIERFGGRRRAVAERVHADPVLLSLESELREALVESGRRFLLTYRHQFGHPDPELAASQAMHLMMVLTEERHSPLPVPRPLQVDDESFIREACRMVTAYLGIEDTG